MKAGLRILFFCAVLHHVWAQGLSTGSTEIAPDVKRGSELAHIVCQTCHLFPGPELLDKKTWIDGALKRMSPLLGVGRINLEKRRDGEILKESGIFPNSPIISEPDWLAICEYYRESAPAEALPQGPRPKISTNLPDFKAHPLKYPGASSLTTMVQIDSAAKRLYIGNAGARSLDLVNSKGELLSRVPVESPPVSITARPEGLYVTLIGNLFPSDERNGKLMLLEKTAGDLKPRVVLDKLPRPVNAVFSDLNGDRREDILLCAFGNYLGKFSWFENLGAPKLSEHPLIELPGAVNAVVADVNKDGLPDVFVLMAQGREGIHLFMNQGGGNFHDLTIANFSPVFGSTHLELADFNGDGFPDLLVTNGDNGEYPSPFKNYHGIRIFLNDGRNRFTQSWFFPMNGAFKALAGDFDGDGDLDIAAISFFPDYEKSPEESFVYLENQGGMKFEPFSFLESASGRWLTMDAGDSDGDGDLDIVLGSFAEGPLSIPIPAGLRNKWQTNGWSVLWLENRTR